MSERTEWLICFREIGLSNVYLLYLTLFYKITPSLLEVNFDHTVIHFYSRLR